VSWAEPEYGYGYVFPGQSNQEQRYHLNSEKMI